MSAREVADAIGRGVEQAGRTVDLCPDAGGGVGTLAALASPLGAGVHSASVSDPLGRGTEASFGLAAAVAIVETAAASGLGLVAPGERDAIAATTRGTG